MNRCVTIEKQWTTGTHPSKYYINKAQKTRIIFSHLFRSQAASPAAPFITLQYADISCHPVFPSCPPGFIITPLLAPFSLCWLNTGAVKSLQSVSAHLHLNCSRWHVLIQMKLRTFHTTGSDASFCFVWTSKPVPPLSLISTALCLYVCQESARHAWKINHIVVFVFVYVAPSGACAIVRTKRHLSMSGINVSMATASSASCTSSSLSNHVCVTCGVCV